MKISHDNHKTGLHWSIERYERFWRGSFRPRTTRGTAIWGTYFSITWLGYVFQYQRHTYILAPETSLEHLTTEDAKIHNRIELTNGPVSVSGK